MRRHLVVAVLAVLGVLVWASAAPAADVLTLCISSGGNVKATATCKPSETEWKVVTEEAFTALAARVTTLEGKVTALETLLAGVSRPNADTLLLTGMNLQVVNGSGLTTDSENRLGNVIIGYNTDNGDTKTGSHNLVIGDRHTYTSSSGVVSGFDNSLTGILSFVAGGQNNTASGIISFVGGGVLNTASGRRSFVAGGQNNTASDFGSFVGGGDTNTASGFLSFVGGGNNNSASADGSFVGSGSGNLASGVRSFVAGGETNTANGFGSFVGSGVGNTASGFGSFVGGGVGNTAIHPDCGIVFSTIFAGAC